MYTYYNVPIVFLLLYTLHITRQELNQVSDFWNQISSKTQQNPKNYPSSQVRSLFGYLGISKLL